MFQNNVAYSISSVAEARDRALRFFRELDFVRWFPRCLPRHGVFIVPHVGFELTTPVLWVGMADTQYRWRNAFCVRLQMIKRPLMMYLYFEPASNKLSMGTDYIVQGLTGEIDPETFRLTMKNDAGSYDLSMNADMDKLYGTYWSERANKEACILSLYSTIQRFSTWIDWLIDWMID